jgi:hypothetical protein
MHLITILDFMVGPIEIWPTNVIRAIFLEEPTLASIKTIVAFFYGNGVPFFIAYQFFFLCNYNVLGRTTITMRLHYEMWRALRFMPHQAVYYNMTFKRLMWLNGRALSQTEFVEPRVSDIPLGIDATGEALTVGFKLHLIKDQLLVFPF